MSRPALTVLRQAHAAFTGEQAAEIHAAIAQVEETFAAADEVIRKGSGGRDWSGHSDAFLARERLYFALKAATE